jgi:cytochrome c oxidase cbb3-type subunit 3
VPRAVWWFIGITHVWALVMWFLMPTWPLVNSYTKGLLGVDQQERVEEDVRELRLARADWVKAFEEQGFDEIRANADLMDIVSKVGPVLFTDNCSGCHGAKAQGGPGFPSLTDVDWLWGGEDETIMETLRVGINAPHPETRVSQMMAFGREGILTREQVRTVVDYIMSLSGSSDVDPVRLAEGAGLFADNCAACHGEDAKGLREMGAPNLTDDIWLYGVPHRPRRTAGMDASLGGPHEPGRPQDPDALPPAAGERDRAMNARMPDCPTGRLPFWSRPRIVALALCGIVLAVFVGANAHLIAVSFSSQPGCVPHLKAPDEGAGQFRAAISSC